MALSLVRRLDALTNAQLATVYNSVSERKITKFSDHSTAVKRAQLALETAGMDIDIDSEGEPSLVPTATVAARRDGDDRIITVQVDKNPKTIGSRSHGRFAMYRTGMTLGEYIDAVKKSGRNRRLAVRDVNWDREHQYIRLD